MAVRVAIRIHLASPRPAFDQHLKVNRAPLISAKAIVEGVIEPGEAHVLATPRVVTIQERAVIRTSTR
jgi:hypothetical protein